MKIPSFKLNSRIIFPKKINKKIKKDKILKKNKKRKSASMSDWPLHSFLF